jgi:hypothetical protein
MSSMTPILLIATAVLSIVIATISPRLRVARCESHIRCSRGCGGGGE